jgi:DNA-binding transcriptional regulator GbsR (MarR family)
MDTKLHVFRELCEFTCQDDGVNEEDRFVERFADTLARSGWPRMSARMFAALMASPDGTATAADLAARLEVGSSAISNGARMLRDLALVDTVRRADRHLVYVVRPDAWARATIGQEDRLRTLETLLLDGAQVLTGAAADRLTEAADFFAFLRERMPRLVDEWRAGRR